MPTSTEIHNAILKIKQEYQSAAISSVKREGAIEALEDLKKLFPLPQIAKEEDFERNSPILYLCKDCKYRWNGDELDEDCPSCESENIKESNWGEDIND